MMKNIISTIFIGLFFIYANNLKAQHGNNWVLTGTTGINFNTNPPTTFTKANYGGYAQSISDCNGKLQIYTHDCFIFNSQNLQLKNQPICAGEFNLLIPKPTDDSAYYYFRQVAGYYPPHYQTIDMRLDSGRGGCDTTIHGVIDTFAIAAGFVKHANDTDYWLLVKTNPYTVNAYLVTNKGIDTIPVKSKMYGANNATKYLRFSNNGKFVISPSSYGKTPPATTDRTHIYNFDTKTGKCSNERVLYNTSYTPSSEGYSYCFSPNDSLIYQYLYYGDVIIRQFETYPNVPYLSRILIYSRSIPTQSAKSFGLQTAPDNRIYFWETDSAYTSHCLSYIAYPDVKGTACSVQSEKACFWPNLISARYFPAMFFPVPRINNHFTVTGADGCGYDSVTLKMDADTNFKSAWWYFGDGDSTEEFYIRDSSGNKIWQGVTHQYKQEGSYYVRLACGLGPCNYKQWVGDSITIKFKPNLSFKTQKKIYCGYQTVDANILYKYTDTLLLSWGDGNDTLIACTNSGTPNGLNLQHIYTLNGSYNISCKVWNKNCLDTSGINYTVNIQPKPQPQFFATYPQSCGSSTFTFIDSSKADSIVNYRYWRITKPDGSNYTLPTTNTNQLYETLSDTGNYHIKLMVQTPQGCTDSIEKQNYIRVNPIPDATMNPSGKVYVCFNDSVKLELKPNVKYLWNNGDTNQYIYVKKAGVYSATVWNAANCWAISKSTTVSTLAPFSATIIKTLDSLYIQTTRAISSYYWLRDTLPFAGNTQRSILHPIPGNYSATLIDTNGCTMKTSSVKVVNGIDQVLESNMDIYPNPTDGLLYISNSSPMHNISLFDLTGKNIEIAPIQNNEGVVVDLTHVAKGVYILKVGGNYKKIVLQ